MLEDRLKSLLKGWRLKDWLNRAREDLADHCRPFVDPDAVLTGDTLFLMVDLGEGWTYAAVSDPSRFEPTDVNEAFSSIRAIERHLDEQGNLNGDLDFLAMHCVRLGRVIERIENGRPLEADAATGKRVKEAAAEGGRNNAALNSQQKQEALRLVAELVGKGLSKTEACRRVGRDFRVSGKTVSRIA